MSNPYHGTLIIAPHIDEREVQLRAVRTLLRLAAEDPATRDNPVAEHAQNKTSAQCRG